MRADTACREIEGAILRETEKAIQFKFEDDDGESHTEWFPLSQVRAIHRSPNKETDADVIEVSEWIYNQKEESWNN